MGARRTLETARTLNIKRRHPLYRDWSALDCFLWDSYVGGVVYDPARYLDRYPRELALVYEERAKRAYYLNYMASVVDSYISEVFRRDPVRELPSNLNPFVEEATLEGEDLTTFTRSILTRAVATDKAFVMVDVSEEGVPYVHEVHPDNVLDFSLADDGSFNWALIAEMVVDDLDPFAERVEEMHYRLWTPDEWILFDKEGAIVRDEDNNEIRGDGLKDGVVPLLSVAPGAMPLQMFDIAQVNKRIYNICSQIDEILINVTFPQLYYQPGALPPEFTSEGQKISSDVSPIETGVTRILELPEGTTITPGFIEPPGGAATLQIEERERLISAIYSMAGLKRRDPDVQVVESGVAKAYDFKEMNARLSSLSQAAEALEEDVLRMVAAWGVGSPDAEFNITYRKDFDVRDFAEMLEQHLLIVDAKLPPAAKRRSAIDVTARIVEDAPPEERTAAIAEAEAMADEDFEPAPNPLDEALANELGGGVPLAPDAAASSAGGNSRAAQRFAANAGDLNDVTGR